MLACPAETYERLKPLMSLMGKTFYVGPNPGQGQAVKLLNNFLSATALAATSEALAFGLADGLSLPVMLEVLNASTGRNSATADKFPNRVLTGTYDAGFSTALMAKDLRIALDLTLAVGTPAALLSRCSDLWTGAEQRLGFGADNTEIVRYLELLQESDGDG